MNDENTPVVVTLDSMLWTLQMLADAFALEPKRKIKGKEISEIILTAKTAIEKDYTAQWIATHRGMH